jgi:hypothetical protein
MIKFLTLTLLLIYSSPVLGSGINWKSDQKSIVANGLSTYSVLQEIEKKFNVTIYLSGDIPNNKIKKNFTDVSLKDAVVSLLKESNISNFSLNFDDKKSILTIKTLRNLGDKTSYSARSFKGSSQLGSLTREELLNVEGILEVEKNDVVANKALTFEEIEELKQGEMLFSQSEAGGESAFTPEQVERLHHETESMKKTTGVFDNSIPDNHLDQLKQHPPAQDKEGVISPDQLNMLEKG